MSLNRRSFLGRMLASAAALIAGVGKGTASAVPALPAPVTPEDVMAKVGLDQPPKSVKVKRPFIDDEGMMWFTDEDSWEACASTQHGPGECEIIDPAK